MNQYSVPFCGWKPFWIDHILFIHSSVVEHLGCFHFCLLWIMILWLFIDKFSYGHIFSILWGKIPISRIAGSYNKSMFTFWGIAKLFSKAITPLYNPTINVWGFKFFHILSDAALFFILAIMCWTKLAFLGWICRSIWKVLPY